MKVKIRLFGILLSLALTLGLMTGISLTAWAEYETYEAGRVWNIGETMNLRGAWFVNSRSKSGVQYKQQSKDQDTVVPTPFISGNSALFDSFLPVGKIILADGQEQTILEDAKAQIEVSIPTGKKGEELIGIKLVKGDGTVDSPYEFEGVWPAASYNLWVGSTEVTSANASDVFKDGTVSYTPTGEHSGTLELKNFTGAGNCASGHRAYIDYTDYDGTLTIIASGSNIIHNTSDNNSKYGIYANGNLIIKGDGVLNVNGGDCTGQHFSSTGIGVYPNRSLNIQDKVTVEAKGGSVSNAESCGIVGGVVNIDATLKASGTDVGILSSAVYINNTGVLEAAGDRAIIGTVVNKVAGTGWTDIEGSQGKTSIPKSNGQELETFKKVQFPTDSDESLWIGTQEVDDDHLDGQDWSYDKDSRTLTLEGVDIEGGMYGIQYYGNSSLHIVLRSENKVSGRNFGIFCSEGAPLTISGDGSLNVSASGKPGYGIRASSGITISGGTVTAEGTDKALDAATVSIGKNLKIKAGSSKEDAETVAQYDNQKWVQIGEFAPITVTFYDGFGNILKTETVEKGGSATPPEDPSKEGLIFDGWNGNYINVSKDTNVYARWKTYPSEYGLWVGITPVNADNRDDILKDGGKASFNPATNTLTLDNPSITNMYVDPMGWRACINSEMEDPLVIKGRASMKNDGIGTRLNGIRAEGDLELNGDFTIKTGYYGVSAESITISGGKINIDAAVGLTSSKTIKINDGIVKCNGQTPIIAYGGLTIEDKLQITEPEGGRISDDGREIVDSKGNEVKSVIIAPEGQKPIEEFMVTFSDGLGGTLKTETVVKGGAATAPEDPVRDGYSFNGWDTGFSNVKADLTVTARWKQNIVTHKVTFEDGQGKVLDEQTVVDGRPAKSPADPTRDGFIFSGWDRNFSSITTDMTVKALWTEESKEEDKYTVVFVFGFGNEPVSKVVNKGQSVTAPAVPEVDGFTFTGWDKEDKEFASVTENLTVTAKWKKNTAENEHTVVFSYGYIGKSPYIVRVLDGQAAIPPTDTEREGYTFTGWDTDFSYVTENMIVIAQWKQDYTPPSDPAIVKTAPAARTLTYNGSAQELVKAGTAEGGTMQYALGRDATTVPASWSDSIPTGTDTGTYYVWYKAKGDEKHIDSTPAYVTAKINPAEKSDLDNAVQNVIALLSKVTTSSSFAEAQKAIDAYNKLTADQKKQVDANAAARKGLETAQSIVKNQQTSGPEKGKTYTVGGQKYFANSTSSVYFKKGKKAKTVTVPATVPINGKKVNVVGIQRKAFYKKTKNVKIKTKKLTKKSVKNCMKGSKVKTVKVPKKKFKSYKKFFTKKNCGKKVTVK